MINTSGIPKQFYIVAVQKMNKGNVVTRYITNGMGIGLGFSNAHLFTDKTKACSAAAKLVIQENSLKKAFVLTVAAPFTVEEIMIRTNYTIGALKII